MGSSRVHYDLGSNSYIGTSLHDLNSGDDEPPPADDDNDDEQTSAVECLHDSYQPLHDNTSAAQYAILTIQDVSPIETARARFLDFVVDHFIGEHVIQVSDYENDYMVQQDKINKRKSKEIRYEGDARYALPLMYVANMYETLANDVNMRLSSINGMREKTIGVALEAAGGLYRKLAKKYPRKGPCVFKRRELATSLETRSRFPELVVQEEKRVRFVVVNGLSIIEKPTKIGIDDAEWFKRLTGRTEVAISCRDYKFYAPRHKYRRMSNSIQSIPDLPAFSGPESNSPMSSTQGFRPATENSEQTSSKQHHMQQHPNQSQFHSLHHSTHHLHMNQSPNATQFMHNQQHCVVPPSQLPDNIAHNQQSSTIAQNFACLQPLGQVGGRLHVLPTSPAKFCDECGVPYLRETSKFCSECGTKRLGNLT